MLVVHGDATGTTQVATVQGEGAANLGTPHSFPAAGLAASALDTADFESSGVQAKTRELPDTAFTESFCLSEWQ